MKNINLHVCPRCAGRGEVLCPQAKGEVVCPLCDGGATVDQDLWDEWVSAEAEQEAEQRYYEMALNDFELKKAGWWP